MSTHAIARQLPASRVIVVAIGMIAAWALAIGFIYPAVTLNMQNRGASASLIGWLGAMNGFGIVANAIFLPAIVARFGRWPAAFASLFGMAASILGFALVEWVPAWFALRFLLGFFNNIIFVVGETWINEAVDDSRRGRVIAIYTSVIALTFSAGPLLVPVLGVSGFQAYGTVALVIALLGLPMWMLRSLRDAREPLPGSTAALYRRVIVMMALPMVAVAAFAAFDGATLALWVVYAQERGLSERAATLTLTALIAGNALLQLPIGWLADRMRRRVLIVLLSAVIVVGSALIGFVDLSSVFGVVYLVVWGAAAFGVYTIALVVIGQRLKGRELVAANAAFGVMWGLFALVGSAATGAAMDAVGPVGLPIVIAMAYLLLMATGLLAGSTREDQDR
ncbi:MAG: MFS transporter [Flavobacteriaceae bacterium]